MAGVRLLPYGAANEIEAEAHSYLDNLRRNRYNSVDGHSFYGDLENVGVHFRMAGMLGPSRHPYAGGFRGNTHRPIRVPLRHPARGTDLLPFDLRRPFSCWERSIAGRDRRGGTVAPRRNLTKPCS